MPWRYSHTSTHTHGASGAHQQGAWKAPPAGLVVGQRYSWPGTVVVEVLSTRLRSPGAAAVDPAVPVAIALVCVEAVVAGQVGSTPAAGRAPSAGVVDRGLRGCALRGGAADTEWMSAWPTDMAPERRWSARDGTADRDLGGALA